MAKEEDIIGTAVFLCSDASSYITGQNIIMMGAYSNDMLYLIIINSVWLNIKL